MLNDGCGLVVFAENKTSMGRFTVQLDCNGSFNLLPSRTSLATYDVLPAGTSQLLQVLTQAVRDDGSMMRCQSQYTTDLMSAEVHSPELALSGAAHHPQRRGGRGGGGPSSTDDLRQWLGQNFAFLG